MGNCRDQITWFIYSALVVLTAHRTIRCDNGVFIRIIVQPFKGFNFNISSDASFGRVGRRDSGLPYKDTNTAWNETHDEHQQFQVGWNKTSAKIPIDDQTERNGNCKKKRNYDLKRGKTKDKTNWLSDIPIGQYKKRTQKRDKTGDDVDTTGSMWHWNVKISQDQTCSNWSKNQRDIQEVLFIWRTIYNKADKRRDAWKNQKNLKSVDLKSGLKPKEQRKPNYSKNGYKKQWIKQAKSWPDRYVHQVPINGVRPFFPLMGWQKKHEHHEWRKQE